MSIDFTSMAAGAGRCKVWTGPQPAYGVDAVFTVPDRTRILVVSVTWAYIRATTAAVHALHIFRGADALVYTKANGNFGTGSWAICAMASSTALLTFSTAAVIMPLPVGLCLEAGDQIRTFSPNITGSDIVLAITVFGYPLPILET